MVSGQWAQICIQMQNGGKSFMLLVKGIHFLQFFPPKNTFRHAQDDWLLQSSRGIWFLDSWIASGGLSERTLRIQGSHIDLAQLQRTRMVGASWWTKKQRWIMENQYFKDKQLQNMIHPLDSTRLFYHFLIQKPRKHLYLVSLFWFQPFWLTKILHFSPRLWDARLTSMVVRHYHADFRWLGYTTDPATLMPTSGSEKMMCGGSGVLCIWGRRLMIHVRFFCFPEWFPKEPENWKLLMMVQHLQ